ncbi:MAG: hypothetical protein NT074_03450 [Methanomicrobiales archaeon]|nr:hypothetical protein [Methanomicrobiales archaeon]
MAAHLQPVFSVFAGSIIATTSVHTYGAVDIAFTPPNGTATGTCVFTYVTDPSCVPQY